MHKPILSTLLIGISVLTFAACQEGALVNDQHEAPSATSAANQARNGSIGHIVVANRNDGPVRDNIDCN